MIMWYNMVVCPKINNYCTIYSRFTVHTCQPEKFFEPILQDNWIIQHLWAGFANYIRDYSDGLETLHYYARVNSAIIVTAGSVPGIPEMSDSTVVPCHDIPCRKLRCLARSPAGKLTFDVWIMLMSVLVREIIQHKRCPSKIFKHCS